MPAYQAIDYHVYDRVRHFLRRRHNVHGAWHRRFAAAAVFGTLGVLQLRRVPLGAAAVCLTMKLVGKPDAGNPHVRFDERGRETERCQSAPSNRAHPRLYMLDGGHLDGASKGHYAATDVD